MDNSTGLWIPKQILEDKNLGSWTEKITFTKIGWLVNNNGCFASNRYLSEYVGVGRHRISQIITKLVKDKYLSIKRTKITDENGGVTEKRVLNLLNPYSNIFNKVLNQGTSPVKSMSKGGLTESAHNKQYNKQTNKQDNIASKDAIKYQDILQKWNTFAKSNSLTTLKAMTEKRKTSLRARLREAFDIDEIIEIIAESDFLKGKNDRGWKVDFDWLIKNDTNFVKIVEGKYGSAKPKDEYTLVMAEVKKDHSDRSHQDKYYDARQKLKKEGRL